MAVQWRCVPACVSMMSLLSATAAVADSNDERLDTVIVTGARIGVSLEETASNGALGSKKLLDTPFSITAVDADEITLRQVNSVAQLFVNDPSIFSSSPSASTAWWGAQIRGLGVHNYYIDGVPFMMSWGGEFPLEPVERVEALKGLTGFMYGFGQPGGAISYTLKKPTEQPLAVTGVEYRNDGVLAGQVDIGGRYGQERAFGYRVNVAGEFGEAYNSADVNRSLASLALDYRFSDSVEWFASAIYEDSDLKHEPLHFYWDLYEGDALPRARFDYQNITVRNSWYKHDTLATSTGLNWRIDDSWTAQLTTGYASQDHKSNRMFADLLNEAGDYAGSAYNFRGLLKSYITQALLQGSASTGSVRHELVFGAAYQRMTSQWGNDWYWSNDFNGNLYEPQTYIVTRTPDFSLAPLSDDDRQKALFASDTLHFGDRWQALLGLRYTDYELVDHDHDPTVDSSYDTHALSPTYAVIFKPSQHVSLYGSYVEALEGGSRVGPDYANYGELLDATVSRQYEVGAKYDHSRLSFTAAAFRVDRAAQMDELRDGLRYLTQDGRSVYDGFEAMGTVEVTRNLTLGAGATWLDASIDRVSADNADIEGNVPAGAAKWQAVASIDYRVPRIAGLTLYGNVRYYDDAYYEDANRVLIPDRTLANVGLQYQTDIAGRRTVFTGSINNLFDERFWELNDVGEGINGALSMRVYW